MTADEDRADRRAALSAAVSLWVSGLEYDEGGDAPAAIIKTAERFVDWLGAEDAPMPDGSPLPPAPPAERIIEQPKHQGPATATKLGRCEAHNYAWGRTPSGMIGHPLPNDKWCLRSGE